MVFTHPTMPASSLGVTAAAPTHQPDSHPLSVELLDVSKRYGPQWAIARLTYRLEPGQSLLLTGHNGSGKTTLLRLISTAILPTAGTLKILGLDCRQELEAVRRQVALLSHASFLYEDLSAEQNVTLLARLLGTEDPTGTAAALLERVGLTTRSSHPVRQFSAGMRKRVAIAKLLLKAPRLALLDEPFGELDPAGIAQMERIIADLQARGTTVILATHLIDQGKALCRRRLHLQDGRAVDA